MGSPVYKEISFGTSKCREYRIIKILWEDEKGDVYIMKNCSYQELEDFLYRKKRLRLSLNSPERMFKYFDDDVALYNFLWKIKCEFDDVMRDESRKEDKEDEKEHTTSSIDPQTFIGKGGKFALY